MARKKAKSQEASKSVMVPVNAPGVKSLEVVATADNIAWLAATPELIQSARAASEFLFSALANTKESQLDKLLTENFDPEQIWQQIDLQATPILSMVKKSLRTIENRTPGELVRSDEKAPTEKTTTKTPTPKNLVVEEPSDDDEEEDDEEEDDEDEDGSDDGNEVEEASKPEEEYSDYDEEDKKLFEDKFLKMSDMEKFLDRADAEDAGIAEDDDDNADADDDEEDDEEDFDMDEAFDFFGRLADKDNSDEGWGPTYADFIGNGKKQKSKPSKRQESHDESEEDDLEGDDDDEDEDDEEEELGTMDNDQQIQPLEEKKLSAHQRRQEKTMRRIEQLERANLETKDWTMQGEVSASKRSKNSALEVELDFEHGARPAPVMTEEELQTLEDMIRSRITEGRYDDPRPRAAPITGAPKERIEMDEEKSKKGLGEIYEQEYMESTGLAVAATPAMETFKAEAKFLFKKLCYRLDALSHYHFAPKPIVEEMQVKVDVPALAMEEVAPLAMTDASMLAPEEVYKSAGLVKGESELTPEERKRRRAQKKRKRRGAKMAEENLKRIRMSNAPVKDPLQELNVRSRPSKDNRTTSSFSKSAKVFAELDKAQERGNKLAKSNVADKPARTASSLKL